MNTPVVLLCVSTLGLIALFAETIFLAEKPRFIQQSDKFLEKTRKNIQKFMKFFNKKTFVLLTHFLIEEIEKVALKVFRWLKHFVRKQDK